MATAVNICDFPNSYVLWRGGAPINDKRKPGHMPWENSVRVQMDARCEITNEKTGKTEHYVLIAPCRTEWMYRNEILWQNPNREFCGIYGEGWSVAGHVEVLEYAEGRRDFKTPRPIKEVFMEFSLTVKNHQKVQMLKSDAEVIEATNKGLPIIARTEILNEANGLKAMMEYPIKTMNYNDHNVRMQVDTGPLLFADLESNVSNNIERMNVSFVCYNNYEVAEFVLRHSRSVTDNTGKQHIFAAYDDIRRVPVKTTFYVAGKL
ncbi:MAG: hypothetical protein FJ319_08825 [SAR202 cluster bacterium]|nr:hypothetical protein [SAR202 cluster bacterium]